MARQKREKNKKKSAAGQVIGLLIALMLLEAEVWEFLGVLLGIALVLSPIAIPLIIYFRRKKHKASHQSALENTTFAPCKRQKSFDERMEALFCFHKDKGLHHVSRGREIDPWDRPDIDISKYQRKE